MRNIIIGTAGHVDHGKTALIKSMTGIDCDRLKEEKKRGITIDIGFSYVDLKKSGTISIIDVPGHEKFIRNMLCGASGIDYAILVIALDEGVMPQTREHIDILTLLDIKEGIVALTKKDLLDDELINMQKEIIKEDLKNTFFYDKKMIAVSSYTNDGIEELKNEIDNDLVKLNNNDINKAFRMPIDRIFSMKGFGTIVTGTLLEGKVDIEKKAMLYPEKRNIKIRGIQVHNNNVSEAICHERVALNISNLDKEDFKRGDVIALEDSIYPSMIIDIYIELLDTDYAHIKNNQKINLYIGSGEYKAKIVIFGKDELKKGENTYAQLRLVEEIALKKFDHFIIRNIENKTIAGGRVIDPFAIKKRHNKNNAKEDLQIKDKGSNIDILYLLIKEFSNMYLDYQTIINREFLDKSKSKNDLNILIDQKKVIMISDKKALSTEFFELKRKNLIKLLSNFHNDNSMLQGMNLEEVKTKLCTENYKKEAEDIINICKQKKNVKVNENIISLYDFKPYRKESDEVLHQKIEQYFLDANVNVPSFVELTDTFKEYKNFKEVFTSMILSKTIIRLDERYFMHSKYVNIEMDKIFEIGENKDILLSEYRDSISSSRKVALALLEYFDRKGITRKDGDKRYLIKKKQ
ncbi:MAG: selenocysteine-specific translation elongation factor [Eubacteriales bacterium]|nr:selenocysteine-specific translation elongation factor [Eubacteriales bacterium]